MGDCRRSFEAEGSRSSARRHHDDALQRLAAQRDRIVALLRGTPPPRARCPIQYRSSYAAKLWAWATEEAASPAVDPIARERVAHLRLVSLGSLVEPPPG